MKKFLLEAPIEVFTPKGHRFRIIPQFCKGCRICVEFCPTQTLGLSERFRVTVLHPEKCIACRMCELRCPDLAIFVQKGEQK
jgi:2-oxoglutarate ferredoxin oxidoreductase subunit delta